MPSKQFRVILDAEQHRRLKALASRRGEPMGSVVRESVARYLSAADAVDDPLGEIIGAFEDTGPTPHGPVSVEHDTYLADPVVDRSE